MKEKNKIVSFVVVLVVLFAVLFLVGKPNPNKNKNVDANSNASSVVSVLKATETLYDFGMISMKNGDVSKTFKVTNISDVDVLIPSLTTSCMCTRAYFIDSDGSKAGPFGMPGMGVVPKLNKIIKAGESADVEVVYDPNAHGPAGVGIIDRFVYLEDENGNKLQFEIKANVTP